MELCDDEHIFPTIDRSLDESRQTHSYSCRQCRTGYISEARAAAHLSIGGLKLAELFLDSLQRCLSMLVFWSKVMLL